ncbi:MAG: MOSC domain-containing protein [Gaiellaceae bacterium]
MPSVARISIAPVKGLGLLHPDEVALEHTGVRANRLFHIVDADGRRYNQLRNGGLVQIRPEYDGRRLALHFPDGSTAADDVALGAEVTVDFYNRPVTGRLVEGPWAAALSEWAGRPLRLLQSEPGAAVDRRRGHVSLVSSASLEELARHGGHDGTVDGRRFRMLFELDGCKPHEEDGWIKRHVRIGEALVRLRGDVGRCAITTQNPETGAPDFDTLKTIRAYREITANEAGKKHLPFGVYGEVVEPGKVALGDPVEVVELSLLEQSA